MTQHFITKKGCIDIYPDTKDAPQGTQITKGTQITIGDLHGNAMKLIYFLLEQGVIEINKTDYDQLNNLYKKSPKTLKHADIYLFNDIIDKLKIKNKPLIRLIGDELADRGENDYYTLKILSKLVTSGVEVEILMSNHSIEFLQASEKLGQNNNQFRPTVLQGGHATSLFNLQKLLDKGLVNHEEIKELSNTYHSLLKPLSYSIDEQNGEITLYSHAAIGLNLVKSLTEKLGIDYDDSSLNKLARTIDSINENIANHIQNKTLSHLLNDEVLKGCYEQKVISPQAYPLEYLMWNRNYMSLNEHRPHNHHDYKINYVHGHDDKDIKNEYVFPIDTLFGKVTFWSSKTMDYVVLASNDTALLKQLDINNQQPINNLEAQTDHQVMPNKVNALAKTLVDFAEKNRDIRIYVYLDDNYCLPCVFNLSSTFGTIIHPHKEPTVEDLIKELNKIEVPFSTIRFEFAYHDAKMISPDIDITIDKETLNVNTYDVEQHNYHHDDRVVQLAKKFQQQLDPIEEKPKLLLMDLGGVFIDNYFVIDDVDFRKDIRLGTVSEQYVDALKDGVQLIKDLSELVNEHGYQIVFQSSRSLDEQQKCLNKLQVVADCHGLKFPDVKALSVFDDKNHPEVSSKQPKVDQQDGLTILHWGKEGNTDKKQQRKVYENHFAYSQKDRKNHIVLDDTQSVCIQAKREGYTSFLVVNQKPNKTLASIVHRVLETAKKSAQKNTTLISQHQDGFFHQDNYSINNNNNNNNLDAPVLDPNNWC